MDATFENQHLDQVAAMPGYQGGYRLERIGDGRRCTLAFFSAGDPRPGRYEVQADVPGAAAGRAGHAVAIGYFDGPLSPARLAAGQFGYQRRIAPALAAVPGLVRTMQLWQPMASALCVVNVGVDLEALEVVGRAVNGTTLLPEEDPALLTGPDRFEIYRVLTGARIDGRALTEGAPA